MFIFSGDVEVPIVCDVTDVMVNEDNTSDMSHRASDDFWYNIMKKKTPDNDYDGKVCPYCENELLQDDHEFFYAIRCPHCNEVIDTIDNRFNVGDRVEAATTGKGTIIGITHDARIAPSHYLVRFDNNIQSKFVGNKNHYTGRTYTLDYGSYDDMSHNSLYVNDASLKKINV